MSTLEVMVTMQVTRIVEYEDVDETADEETLVSDAESDCESELELNHNDFNGSGFEIVDTSSRVHWS